VSGGSGRRNCAARGLSGRNSGDRLRSGVRGNIAAVGNRRRNSNAESEVFGALDLGTNNCRLLVARPAQDGFQVVDSFSRVVRLGEGLSYSDYLSDSAIERTLKALKICAGKMRHMGVTQARCVATEACRRASNYSDFQKKVAFEFGLELELISSFQETQLAVYGCEPLFDPAVETALVFDIGGGSTEVSWVALSRNPRERGGAKADSSYQPAGFNGALEDPRNASWDALQANEGIAGARSEPLAWKSLPMGVTSLAERFGGGDLSVDCYERMVAAVLEELQPFETENLISGPIRDGRVQMLGTSGTVTTLVGIEKNLPRYDRRRVDGAYLSRDSIESLNRRVAAMSYQERVAHPCIGPERADLVVAGCAILDALCRTWPVERLRVADRGLREGIIFTLMRGIVA